MALGGRGVPLDSQQKKTTFGKVRANCGHCHGVVADAGGEPARCQPGKKG